HDGGDGGIAHVVFAGLISARVEGAVMLQAKAMAGLVGNALGHNRRSRPILGENPGSVGRGIGERADVRGASVAGPIPGAIATNDSAEGLQVIEVSRID